MKRLVLLGSLIAIISAGCATYGPEMTVVQHNQIIKAETEALLKVGMSKKEVLELLGEPQMKNKDLILSTEYWFYTARKENNPFRWIHSRALRLAFEKNELVSFRRLNPVFE